VRWLAFVLIAFLMFILFGAFMLGANNKIDIFLAFFIECLSAVAIYLIDSFILKVKE